nr:hypothetical protein [Tanacetum cinerariifolium]
GGSGCCHGGVGGGSVVLLLPWCCRCRRGCGGHGGVLVSAVGVADEAAAVGGGSDEEVNLRVDNVIQNSKHEYPESEDSDLDNPLLPLRPPKPPDKEFDFEIEKEISVVRNLIVNSECIDARMKFDVFKFIMFSLLSAESEDTIFDPGISE